MEENEVAAMYVHEERRPGMWSGDGGGVVEVLLATTQGVGLDATGEALWLGAWVAWVGVGDAWKTGRSAGLVRPVS